MATTSSTSCDEEIVNLRLPHLLSTASTGAATSADDTVNVVVTASMPTPEPSRSRRRKTANPMKLSELTARGSAVETVAESPQCETAGRHRKAKSQPSYSTAQDEESPASIDWDDSVDDSSDYVLTISEVSDDEASDQLSEDVDEDWSESPPKKVCKAPKAPRKPLKKRASAKAAASSGNAVTSEEGRVIGKELETDESGAVGVLEGACQEAVAEVELVAVPLPVAAAPEPSKRVRTAKAKAAGSASPGPRGDPRKTQKAFQCPRCWRSFDNLKKWQKHIDYHDSPMPYQCEHCGKRFRQPGNLKMHNRVHTGEKPYTCGFCIKVFRFPSELSSHEQKHIGMLPDCCSICGDRFKDGGSLRRHMLRLHKDQSQNIRVRCKVCRIWFSTQALLDEHVCRPGNTGHSLACPICHSEFDTALEMQAHDCVKKQEAYPAPAVQQLHQSVVI